jgi:16S rRNA (adenine1518-N6/adenine1519-N6)-dimethyltransferase
LRFHPPDPPVRSRQIFEALVQSVFTRRRKTLANALRAYEQRGVPSQLSPSAALERAGLDGRRRPEALTIGEFVRLADVFVC